jgi:signal transduction histidine kinase
VLQNIFDMTEMEPEILEMSRGALARLEHLIDSVLLLNEINSSGVKLEPQILDGPAWAEKQVRPILERHGRLEWHNDLPPGMLEFDAFKLGVAIDSVVENAFKFGGRRVPEVCFYCSTRSVVTACMESPQRFDAELTPGFLRPGPSATAALVEHPDDLMLIIEVRDDGIGIPRTEQEAVFQPFTQAANSPTRGVRGAGLGLAMAKRIVDAHGGEIFCRSAVNQGTVFYVAVPAAPAHGA